MPRKVCVVAVAGLYRSGKSSMLNWLLGRGAGFRVGPTVEACTRGIWIWGRPLPVTLASGEEVQVLVMDTEVSGCQSSLQRGLSKRGLSKNGVFQALSKRVFQRVSGEGSTLRIVTRSTPSATLPMSSVTLPGSSLSQPYSPYFPLTLALYRARRAWEA